MDQSLHTGISFDGLKLHIVSLKGDKSDFKLDYIDEVYFENRLNFLFNKETKIYDTLKTCFDEISLDFNLSNKSINIAPSLDLFMPLQCPVESGLNNDELLSEFKLQYSLLYPYISQDNLLMQHFSVKENLLYKYKTAIIIASHKKYLNLLNKLSEDFNFNFKTSEYPGFSSLRGLKYLINNQDLYLVLYIEMNTISLMILEDSQILFLKQFPFLNYHDIKLSVYDELYKLDFNLDRFNKIYILGSSLSRSLTTKLGELLGPNFEDIDIIRNIKYDEDLLNSKPFFVNNFSAALGAALRTK